jgi:hypothetical protein
MSNLTDLLPAGAGGKQVSFVASGTIGNGVTVGLNSDGTVTAVASDGLPEIVGTEATFEAGSTYYTAITYDTVSEKIVIAYRDTGDSNQGKAVVGTVSGTSISFGTPVVFDTGNSQFVSIAYAGTNAVVISYMDGNNNNYGTSTVGSVSGTSISFGAYTVFGSHSSYYITSAFDSAQNKLVVFYGNQTSSYAAILRVGTVSGTSISFGSALTVDNSGAFHTSCVYDPINQKTICAYADSGDSTAGRAFVATVSGTSISAGNIATFQASGVNHTSLAYDSSNEKIVLAYRLTVGYAVIGTVSGTDISFGSAVSFATNVGFLSTAFNSGAGKSVIFYEDVANSRYGTYRVGTVSGTSITFDSAAIFNNERADYIASAYDSTTEKIVVAFRDSNYPSAGAGYGQSFVFQNEASNYRNFIGISDAAISDAASGSVTIKGGISTNVTGLTPNQNYYVQTNGTLSTTASSVLAGKALSSTSINLDYTT